MMSRMTRRSVIGGTVAIATVPVSRTAQAVAKTVHQIEIRSFEFHPSLIKVRVGDTIRWTNKDLAPHTATADEFGWDTGALERGDSGEISATEGMETTYFCVFHPHMKGRIEIDDNC